MANRQKATKVALEWIDAILPGSENTTRWKARLEGMTDPQFKAFIDRLASGEEILSLSVPNLTDTRLSIERNLDVAEKMNYPMFEHLWLTDHQTGQVYKTPERYLLIDLPVRKQSQVLSKKISIGEDTTRTDDLTGQVAGKGGAGLSFPEIQALYAQGIDKPLEEMLKYRGGDEIGYRAMTRAIVTTGDVRISNLEGTTGKTRSTQTLSTLLKGAHLDNNL